MLLSFYEFLKVELIHKWKLTFHDSEKRNQMLMCLGDLQASISWRNIGKVIAVLDNLIKF